MHSLCRVQVYNVKRKGAQNDLIVIVNITLLLLVQLPRFLITGGLSIFYESKLLFMPPRYSFPPTQYVGNTTQRESLLLFNT